MGDILRNQLLFWGPLVLWMLIIFGAGHAGANQTDTSAEPTKDTTEKQADEEPDCE